MTTILTTFIISLALSLLLTPIIGNAGKKYGLLDIPDKRKLHTKPIPRIGGVAIFLSFMSTLLFINLFKTKLATHFIFDHQMYSFFLGGAIIFGIGLFDDFKNLSPAVKLFFQIISASAAYYGGMQINGFDLFDTTVNFGIFSYFITVFWFLLFINAVNLADGLDGLAAGLVFFVCLVMIVLLLLRDEYLIAMITVALCGSTLGFLKYNFNPATIFLGDCGSYFLGYTLAALSILGSFKSQMGAIMLIPFIALGIPLFDTLIAPIRRFIYGQRMFRPDSDHIHHRLIKMGLSHYGAVIVLYSATVLLGIMAITLVNIRDEQAGLFLVLIGVCACIIVHKLGYFKYFAINKVKGWFKDIGSEIGITKERRSFLNLQVNIIESKDILDLWDNSCIAIEEISFDMAEIYFDEITGFNKSFEESGIVWLKFGFTNFNLTKNFLKIELPLLDSKNNYLGKLCLYKDLKSEKMKENTLRRVELLKNTMIRGIETQLNKKLKKTERSVDD